MADIGQNITPALVDYLKVLETGAKDRPFHGRLFNKISSWFMKQEAQRDLTVADMSKLLKNLSPRCVQDRN